MESNIIMEKNCPNFFPNCILISFYSNNKIMLMKHEQNERFECHGIIIPSHTTNTKFIRRKNFCFANETKQLSKLIEIMKLI